MTMEKPAHIVRFENYANAGAGCISQTTAGSVALVIGALRVQRPFFRGKAFRSTRWLVRRLRWWTGWCCPNATATTTIQPTPSAKTNTRPNTKQMLNPE